MQGQTSDIKWREEKDTFGPILVPADKYWAAQTQRSLNFFNIGSNCDKMPLEVVQALGIIKKCAAKVNIKYGLDQTIAQAVILASDQVISGKLNEHFPLVVWQTGSGTQSNMNANEVIANRANQILKGVPRKVHPNDDVNFGQSSNDSFPTAMHIAAAIKTQRHLLPALKRLLQGLEQKSKDFEHICKIGRTHLQDATPITLGQQFSAFSHTLSKDIKRIQLALQGVLEIAQGGTAVGTGLNTFEGFAQAIAVQISKQTTLKFTSAPNKFSALASHEDLVNLHGSLNVLASNLNKLANDVRLLGSGPRCGLGELLIPENEPGSSIMPGKVNPTQCEALSMVCCQVMGNNVAVSLGGMNGHLQLNVYKPLIIRNVLHSLQLLGDVSQSFLDHCLNGIKPNVKKIQKNLDESLMLVTALTPHIGYAKAAEIAKKAHKEGKSLKQTCLELNYVSEQLYNKVVRAQSMLAPSPYISEKQ